MHPTLSSFRYPAAARAAPLARRGSRRRLLRLPGRRWLCSCFAIPVERDRLHCQISSVGPVSEQGSPPRFAGPAVAVLLFRDPVGASTSGVQSAPLARRGIRRRFLRSPGRRWLRCCWGRGAGSARLHPRCSPSSPPVHRLRLSAQLGPSDPPFPSSFPPTVVLTDRKSVV